ncbi:MAG: tRNA (guanosine(37)-N1)-methyltransferase TrmD [Candidatus Paceibacterota bacterium]
MRFHIITTFPEIIRPYTEDSILKRAQSSGAISITFYNPRDFTTDKHHKTDDIPYGGGPGMVMYAEPVLRTVESIKSKVESGEGYNKFKIIHFSPAGKQFTNTIAKGYTKYTDIVLICGRYEGIDARVKKILKGDEISVGPYVLTGGELPALIVADAVSRQISGVLGNESSIEEKRVSAHDVYTRPEILEWKEKRYKVPAVLTSGNHKKIDEWKKAH